MLSSGTSPTSASDAVLCEFVRQRCTHDALFQPFYKRSNRTKGSKILRCFPHCCPNHAHRGFCGSSLHVRVQWGASATPPPSLHVFGRFRLADTAPLPPGHRLPASSVFSSVQSDDTPNGEWIESQMIYSWSETNWLFEINSAARWFYGWESSTVKSQRLKDHVLDVYVLATIPSGIGHSVDALQVVASTTSPPFQLISFRRATDDAMLALSATHHMRQQLQSGHSPTNAADDELHVVRHPHPHLDPHPHPRPLQQHPQFPAHAHAVHNVSVSTVQAPRPFVSSAPLGQPLPSIRSSAFVTSASSVDARPQPHQWTAPPLSTAVASTRTHPMSLPSGPQALTTPSTVETKPEPQVGWRPQSSAPARTVAFSGGGGTEKTVWELTNLIGQLNQIPLADAFERVAWMQETYEDYVTAYMAMTTSVDGVEKTSPVLKPPRQRVDAEMSLRRTMAVIGDADPRSHSRKIPARLLATLTELALWLFFDPDGWMAVRGALNNAQGALFDPVRIRRHFGRMIFWLHDHIGRYLHLRFNTTIRDILLECQELGMEIQYSGSAATLGGAITGRNSVLAGMKGIDSFVAQLRELHVDATKHERRGHRRPRSDLGRPLPPPPAAQALLRRQFSARWSCPLDRISVRPVHGSAGVSTRLSLLSLVWFWRQFSIVKLDLSADTASATSFSVASLFQSSPLGSDFVLDGHDRFFHAFPAGEATLGTCVGRYSFGDYVGHYATAVGEIQLVFYAFLSASQVPTVDGAEELPLELIAREACYCYHVRLLVTPASTLVANVTVRRGLLDVAALRHVGYSSAWTLLEELPTWSLKEKLSAVRSFEDQYHAELVYSHY